MIRTIIKPNTPNINLLIPVEYIGEEVEILVFPINNTINAKKPGNYEQEQHAKRREAFNNFMKYKGTLPADFDYRKELSEYRDTRYGHID